MSPQYGELGLLAAPIGLRVWGTPTNFNGFRVLASLLQRRRSSDANQTLHMAVSWAATVYVHFWGLLPSDLILPRAKFTLCPSLAFSYIGSITAWHSISGVSETLQRGTRNGISELLQRVPSIFGWAAIMLGIGPHSSLVHKF